MSPLGRPTANGNTLERPQGCTLTDRPSHVRSGPAAAPMTVVRTTHEAPDPLASGTGGAAPRTEPARGRASSRPRGVAGIAFGIRLEATAVIGIHQNRLAMPNPSFELLSPSPGASTAPGRGGVPEAVPTTGGRHARRLPSDHESVGSRRACPLERPPWLAGYGSATFQTRHGPRRSEGRALPNPRSGSFAATGVIDRGSTGDTRNGL
jgi:hypothetical protein